MSKTDIGFGPDWLKPKPKPSSQTSQPDLFQSASPVVSSSPFTLPLSSQYGSGQNSNSGSVSGNVTVNGGTPKAAKFRPHLAKNRYGREDMLALYHCVVDPDTSTIERPDGDEFLISDNNPWLTSKGFHEPINLQPFNEQDQRAFQQGINSPLCLRQFSNINTNDPNIHVVGGGQGSFGPGSRQGSVQDGNYEDRIGRGMDQRKMKKDRPGKPGILDGPPEVTDRRGRGMGSVSSMSQSMNDADWAGMQSGNTTPAEGENSFFTGKKPGGAVPGGKGGRLTRSDHTDWRKPRAKDEAPRHPWRRPGAPDEKPGDMGAPPGSSGRTSPRLGRQGSVPEKAVGGKGSRRLSQDKWSDMAEPAPNRRRDRNMPLWMDDDDPDFDPSASQMPELTEKEMRGINGKPPQKPRESRSNPDTDPEPSKTEEPELSKPVKQADAVVPQSSPPKQHEHFDRTASPPEKKIAKPDPPVPEQVARVPDPQPQRREEPAQVPVKEERIPKPKPAEVPVTSAPPPPKPTNTASLFYDITQKITDMVDDFDDYGPIETKPVTNPVPVTRASPVTQSTLPPNVASIFGNVSSPPQPVTSRQPEQLGKHVQDIFNTVQPNNNDDGSPKNRAQPMQNRNHSNSTSPQHTAAFQNQMQYQQQQYAQQQAMAKQKARRENVPRMPDHSQKFWFYRDPYNNTQGPFGSDEMLEWCKSGYFSEDLLVRRQVDNTWIPLGKLMNWYGLNYRSNGTNCFEWPVGQELPMSEARPQASQQQQQQRSPYSMNHSPEQQHGNNSGGGIMSAMMSLDPFASPTAQNPKQSHQHQMGQKNWQNDIFNQQYGSNQQQQQMMQQQQQREQQQREQQHREQQARIAAEKERQAREKQAEMDRYEKERREREYLEQQQRREQEQREAQYRAEQEAAERKRRADDAAREAAAERHRAEQEAMEKQRMVEQQQQQEMQRAQQLKKEQEAKMAEQKRQLEEAERLRQVQAEQERQEKIRRQIEEEQRREMEFQRQRQLQHQHQQAAQQAAEAKLKQQQEANRLRAEQMQAEEERLMRAEQERMAREYHQQRQQAQQQQQQRSPKHEQKPAWGSTSNTQVHHVTSQEKVDLREIQRLEMEARKKEQAKEFELRQKEQRVMQQKQHESKSAGWSGLFGGNKQMAANDFPQSMYQPPTKPQQSLADIQREEMIQKQRQAAAAARDAHNMQQAQPKPKPTPQTNSWSAKMGGGGNNPWGAPNRSQGFPQSTHNFTDPNDIAQVMGMDEFYDPAIKGVQTATKPSQNKSNKKAQSSNQSQNRSKQPAQTGGEKWEKAGGKSTKARTSIPKESPVQECDQLAKWAIQSLKKLKAPGGIDLPTFVEIIKAIDAPWEVKEITMNYFGETKEAKNFATVFIEKRIEIKKQAEAEEKKKKEIEKAKNLLERRKRAQEEAILKRKQELENRKASNDSDGGKNGSQAVNSQVGQFFSNF